MGKKEKVFLGRANDANLNVYALIKDSMVKSGYDVIEWSKSKPSMHVRCNKVVLVPGENSFQDINGKIELGRGLYEFINDIFLYNENDDFFDDDFIVKDNPIQIDLHIVTSLVNNDKLFSVGCHTINRYERRKDGKTHDFSYWGDLYLEKDSIYSLNSCTDLLKINPTPLRVEWNYDLLKHKTYSSIEIEDFYPETSSESILKIGNKSTSQSIRSDYQKRIEKSIFIKKRVGPVRLDSKWKKTLLLKR